MRRAQTHHDRCRCVLRLWWMPLLQLALLASCATTAKVRAAEAFVKKTTTGSERVQLAGVDEAADDRNAAEDTASSDTKDAGTAGGDTKSQAVSEAGKVSVQQGEETAAAEANEEPAPSDEKDSEAKQEIAVVDDEKTAEGEKLPTNQSAEEADAKKMNSEAGSASDAGEQPDVTGAGDATSKTEAGDATPNTEAGDATADTEAGDATPNTEAGDAAPNTEAGDATADTEEGDATADVETEPAIEVDPTEEAPADEVKKPVPAEPPKKGKPKEKCVIGATATLLEKQSELLFRARVDSGAKSCSMHIEKMKIENEAEKMVDNIGKIVQFQVKNNKDKAHWLESKIAGYVIVKTAQSKERRYKVPLTFRWKHMEKEVLVTLSDRNHMEYPLLLGRNFLRGDFLVDVELDSDD